MEWLREQETLLAAAQLVLATLGMGATLKAADFAGILAQRSSIALVLFLQFLVAPFVAMLLIRCLPLPSGIAFGILLLAVMPSGALSNLFTHLSGGNMPLSVTATCASTCVCLLGTPWLLRLFSGSAVPPDIEMPVASVVHDVTLFLLAPMMVGMAVARTMPSLAKPFSIWTVRGSLLVLLLIVVSSLQSGRIRVWEHGWLVPTLLVACVIAQYMLTQIITRALRLAIPDCNTLAIEVAIRNGNLAILLSATLFTAGSTADQELSRGALYVALFYGGAALALASLGTALNLWLRRLRTHASPLPDPIPATSADSTRQP